MKHDLSLHNTDESNWHELAACQGKTAFDTYAAANRVAKRRMKSGDKRVAYKCQHCKKYHVGNSGTAKKRPLKEVK